MDDVSSGSDSDFDSEQRSYYDESSDDSATSSLTQLYQRDNESVPKFHRRVAKVVKVFKC